VRPGGRALTSLRGTVEPPAFRSHLRCPIEIDCMERGKAVSPPRATRGKPTVRQADGRAALRGRKKRRPSGKRTDRACNRAQPQTARPSARRNGVPTSDRCFGAREPEESSQRGKQMTSRLTRDGAPRDRDARAWEAIDWRHARRQVRRLQVRIAQAVKEDRWGRARALQRILTRSFYAKALAEGQAPSVVRPALTSVAVKRVTSNKGKNTPGVDGVLWRDARRKMQAVLSLHSHGYRPQPLRRIYIPKKNGKKRPLGPANSAGPTSGANAPGIPTVYDRAMQALYKLALAPVAEMTADPNSYGFREGRSCHDAVGAAWPKVRLR